MEDGSLSLARGLIPKLVQATYVVLSVGLTSCARSPAQQADEAMAEIRSWDATLGLVDRAAALETVPGHFAADARRAVAEGRAKAQAKLRHARAR
jgi:hypothetical protein